MRLPDKFGIIFTIVFVTTIISLINGITVPVDLKQSLFGIPIAIVVALFVWYLTTNKDRENRKYTRHRIAMGHLRSVTIAHSLINVPQYRNRINEMVDGIYGHYEDMKKRAEIQSHLLYADEIDRIEHHQLIMHDIFDNRLRTDPHNTQLLQEFFDFLQNNFLDYVQTHKLKEFSEYVVE